MTSGRICTDFETELPIRLAGSKLIPTMIQQFTGITDELLADNGIYNSTAAFHNRSVLDAESHLIVAYKFL